MSIGAMMVGFALLVLAVPYVAGPIFQKNKGRQASSGRQAPARKQVLATQSDSSQPEPALLALRDLDFDYQIGKVSDEDYQTLRTRLVVEAAQLLEAAQKAKADKLE